MVTARLNTAATAQGSVQLKGGDTTVKANPAFKDGVAEAQLTVPNAHLWSDKDPYLYDLTVRTDGDRYALKVGIHHHRHEFFEGYRLLLRARSHIRQRECEHKTAGHAEQRGDERAG